MMLGAVSTDLYTDTRLMKDWKRETAKWSSRMALNDPLR